MVKNSRLYDVLGVQPGASTDEIKKAYRQLAIKFHPDKVSSGVDESIKSQMTEKFKEITRAHEILSDPSSRQKYDMFGEEAINQDSNPNGFSFPFPFGRPGQPDGFQARKKVQPIGVPLTITLSDVYHCSSKMVTYQRKVYCQECQGQGGHDTSECGKCNGKGAITQVVQLGPGFFSQSHMPCPQCHGKRKVPKEVCQSCRGECIVDQTIEETVKIESGVKNNDKVILEGKGHHPDKELDPGDVIVILEIEPHPVFQTKGSNLIYEHSIPLVQALCGGQIIIQHLGGHKIIVNIDMVIHPDQLYFLHGEGLPKVSSQKGDLILRFNVVFPPIIDLETKTAIKNLLKKTSTQDRDTSDIDPSFPCRELDCYESTLQLYKSKEIQSDDDRSDHPEIPGGIQCQSQ